MSFGEQFSTTCFNIGDLRPMVSFDLGYLCTILIVFMVFIQGKYFRSSSGGIMVLHHCTAIKGIVAVHFCGPFTQLFLFRLQNK